VCVMRVKTSFVCVCFEDERAGAGCPRGWQQYKVLVDRAKKDRVNSNG